MGTGHRNTAAGLVEVASLEEYFRDSIDAALATNHVVVDTHTSHYVVNLMTLFSRSESFFEDTGEGPRLKPLALMLADALEAESADERNFSLQRLGDVSLFIAGFFADALRDGAVDMDYYVNMGGGAYRTLSVSVRGTTRGTAFCEVFQELAAKFQDLVDVLNEVRESARVTDEDVLRIYELWQKTGSRRAARRLRAMGVHPIGTAKAPVAH